MEWCEIYELAADEAGLVWAVNVADQLVRASDGLTWNPKGGGAAKVAKIITACIRCACEKARSFPPQAVAKSTRVPGAVGARARTVSP